MAVGRAKASKKHRLAGKRPARRAVKRRVEKKHRQSAKHLGGRGLAFIKKELKSLEKANGNKVKAGEHKRRKSGGILEKIGFHEHKTKLAARIDRKFSVREPTKLIVIQKPANIEEANIKYPLLEPFAYANITWSKGGGKLLYSVTEPVLSDNEKETLKKIEDYIEEMIDVKLSTVEKTSELVSYLQKIITQAITILGLKIDEETYSRIMYYIYRNFVGMNEIEPLLHDPYIEDIGCVGADINIYIVHKVFGSLETNIKFAEEDYIENFVIKLAERCGRYVSYAQPMFDGSLPDGSRVQATMAKDVTTRGASFSIRKFRKNPFSPVDIVNLNTASAELMAYLWLLIQYNRNIMVCGGVATGKTTFLNAMCMFIPEERKVVSIEDTREINIVHENWIPAVARVGFGIPELTGLKYGEVELFDLLKESFRQKPDYIIVGEVRGKEAYVLFQGMASGNPSMGTMHAGSVDDIVRRLETPPIELSPMLIESLDAVIIMSVAKEMGESARRVRVIEEIVSIDMKTGNPKTVRVFEWDPKKDSFSSDIKKSVVLKKISYDRGISINSLIKEVSERKKIIEILQKKNISNFEDACKNINTYYKNPKSFLKSMQP